MVGPSGAGKSTLFDLLLGFLTPDGNSWNSMAASCAAAMSQSSRSGRCSSPTRFGNNLCVGAARTDAELEQACQAAGIWTDIEALPHGLGTEVTEAGSSLSGGQRQRLALARALLVKRPVLLVDEPTSALDSSRARAVVDTLHRVAADRIVIMISHRPETLEGIPNVLNRPGAGHAGGLMRVPASLKAFGSLVPALRPEWPGMVRSYVIGTISAMSLVALTVLSAWAVGHAVVDRVLPGPVLWLGLGGLILARTVLTWREMDVSHALAYRVLARLRMALFDAYARSVPGKKREHSGRVASVAMDDIEKLEFFYAHTIAQVATSITVFLASAITALAIPPPAGGVVVLGGAVIATSAFYWAHTARRLGAAEQHERTEMSAGIVDALGALREVPSPTT